ncbi:hypothetical protein SUGI_1500680 [Cryptomeria japonica]|uniref:Uncharacterized protein n=1 Tax=Cryptomeria japonica TaxID=3369 RepID=A0AAD3NT78_CRYJA|nr:expansin-B3-like [Cryptomeria japonica]GLJ59271.1 hypothetical protein SUGI_1500680 [Cryptomeria japonica]
MITRRVLLLGLTILVIYTTVSLAGSKDEQGWQPATATWYGPPEGDGSTGGACGFGDLVDKVPYKTKVSAGNLPVWKNGKGCGSCYKVKCSEDICSGEAVPLIITDECPGCSTDQVWFDLSGSAFGRMAVPGQADALRNKGKIKVLYERTKCMYPGWNLAFRVNEGSSEYYFSVLIMYEGGDGDVASVKLKQAGSSTWTEMQQSWGAIWSLTGVGPIKAPFSLSLTSLSTAKTVTAMDVIPSSWYPTATYTSSLQLFYFTSNETSF